MAAFVRFFSKVRKAPNALQQKLDKFFEKEIVLYNDTRSNYPLLLGAATISQATLWLGLCSLAWNDMRVSEEAQIAHEKNQNNQTPQTSITPITTTPKPEEPFSPEKIEKPPLAPVGTRLGTIFLLITCGTLMTISIQYYASRAVRQMKLLKGGKEVLIQSYALIPKWKNRVLPIGDLSCKKQFGSEEVTSKKFFTLNAKGHYMPYLLEHDSKMENLEIFHYLFMRG